MKCSLGISDFLEEISSLSHFIVFLYLCINHWGRLYLSFLFFGTLHLNGYIFRFLLYLLHLFFSQLFVSPPQTTILPFWISFLGMVLIPASCTVSHTSVHSSSGSLSIRSSPLNLFVWIFISFTVSPLHIWTGLIVTSFTSLYCNEICLPALSPHLSLFCPWELCRICLICLQHDRSLDVWR